MSLETLFTILRRRPYVSADVVDGADAEIASLRSRAERAEAEGRRAADLLDRALSIGGTLLAERDEARRELLSARETLRAVTEFCDQAVEVPARMASPHEVRGVVEALLKHVASLAALSPSPKGTPT